MHAYACMVYITYHVFQGTTPMFHHRTFTSSLGICHPLPCGDRGVHHPWRGEDVRLPAEISREEGLWDIQDPTNHQIKNSIFIGYIICTSWSGILQCILRWHPWCLHFRSRRWVRGKDHWQDYTLMQSNLSKFIDHPAMISAWPASDSLVIWCFPCAGIMCHQLVDAHNMHNHNTAMFSPHELTFTLTLT